jgi:hypothetical protein
MSERARPVILPGGDVVTPGDPERLSALILAYRHALTVVSSPKLRYLITEQLRVTEEALVRAQQAAHRAAARASAPGTAPVLPPAEPVTASERVMVTVAEAAGMIGCSDGWVRRLARVGVLDGRRAPRNVWEISRASVTGYAEERRRRRGYGSPEHRDEGEDHGGTVGSGCRAA